jgi:uncharacterized HAD superfamily protein
MLDQINGLLAREGDIGEASGSSRDSNEFGEFLLSEYSNIAQAHFKTIETISEFLKHYLTIISAPIAVLGFIVSVGSVRAMDYKVLTGAASIAAILFMIISFVGLMALLYIINLRMDALLYARTVNGIRKYFYDRESQLGIAVKNKLRVLPQSPLTPAYRRFRFFGPVVLIFASLNTAYYYPGSAVFAFFRFGVMEPFTHPAILAMSSLFFAAHIGAYLYYAHLHEGAYLRSNILGVDIDGVVNRHREQFCRFLLANTGKRIDPEAIITIPVQDCPGLGITREDEKLVFNDPTYWTEMPVARGAADALKRLRSSIGLRVYFFTYKPWPITDGLSRADRVQINHNWANTSRDYTRHVRRNVPWWTDIKSWLRSVGASHIDRITRAWLQEHSFPYDKVLIEKRCNAGTSKRANNRIQVARTNSIRCFVEDDLSNARKLAFICDVVFLVDHPYNQANQLPANVIRVRSWDEILRHVREIW